MTTSFAPLTVAIGYLTAHPANVRSNSPETYDSENIAHLKASIAVLGLLQPLLVQKLDGSDHLGRRGIDLACDENGNRRCGSGFGRTGHGIPSGNERARDHKCAEHEGQVRARTVGAASTVGCGISKA